MEYNHRKQRENIKWQLFFSLMMLVIAILDSNVIASMIAIAFIHGTYVKFSAEDLIEIQSDTIIMQEDFINKLLGDRDAV